MNISKLFLMVLLAAFIGSAVAPIVGDADAARPSRRSRPETPASPIY